MFLPLRYLYMVYINHSCSLGIRVAHFVFAYVISKIKFNVLSYSIGLVFSEYLLSGLVPSVREVNAEEPLFPAILDLNVKPASEVG